MFLRRRGKEVLPLPTQRRWRDGVRGGLFSCSGSKWRLPSTPAGTPGCVRLQSRPSDLPLFCAGSCMGQPSVGDLLSMACHLSTSGSYTVVIIPLRTSLYSREALRFYLWIKRMKDLEKEKDALWSGLEVLEKSRLWYVQRLVENRNLRCAGSRNGTGVYHKRRAEPPSCLPTHIQRVNGSLGSIMSEPTVSSSPCLSDPLADSDLRWQNTVLTKKVSERNRRISRLELEKKALLEELEDLQAC